MGLVSSGEGGGGRVVEVWLVAIWRWLGPVTSLLFYEVTAGNVRIRK